MPRRTEIDIRIGETFDPNANQRFRVLKSEEYPGTFTLVEADPEALKKAKTEGKPFNWTQVAETDGLTAEQVGRLISEKLLSAT